VRAPATLAAIPFLIGCVASLLRWPSPPEFPVVSTGAAALALAAAIALAASNDDAGAWWTTVAGCLCAGMALGSIAADRVYNPSLLAWYSLNGTSGPVLLEGTLREDAAAIEGSVSIVLDVDLAGAERVSGGVRLAVAGTIALSAADSWRRGRRLRLPARLRRPATYRNPGSSDEARALARRGICLVGSVKSAALVERVSDGSVLQESAAAARAWARRRLSSAIGPTSRRSAAVATAILIGDRTDLDEEDERRLQHAGTYHVIAISGGNVAIVTVALMWIARACFLPQAVAAVLTIGFLLVYGQIAGPSASVQRAVAAATIFLAARIFDHRGPALNAVAVAALLLVAASPATILDPGFLLSFGATLGILLGTPLLVARPRRDRGGRARRGLAACGAGMLAILAATACAEIALAPIAASLFGRVTCAGLLLNFVAIPAMTAVQVAGAAVLLFAGLPADVSALPVWVVDLAATALIDSARLVELAPWLSMAVNHPSWPLLGAYYAAAIASLSARLRPGAPIALAGAGALMLAGPTALARDSVPPPRHPLRVVFLDVGQGDATLIAVPPSHALLVDAGGVAAFGPSEDAEGTPRFDIGDRVVAPALRALGVSHLDALVATHGDPDHILGAPAILRALRVGSVWEGIPVPPHPGLRALRGAALAAGVTWRTVLAGDREAFGPAEIRVLHPPPPDWERQRVRNEDSVVLEVRLGNVSLVLAGDIGSEGEHAILGRLEPGRLTVLKAGHHGSATSSTRELLEALAPAAVIFSAGRDNRFGHPHPTVVDRFRATGTAVFRTDQDGAVLVETDGEVVEVRGWGGRAGVLTTRANAHTKARRHDDTKE
jgi:competence protein ComEC